MNTPNINWASGQDDVPPAPEGIVVMSEGKASKAYIAAKEKDINDGLEVITALIKSLYVDDNITPIQLDIIKSSLQDVKACMMRALL